MPFNTVDHNNTYINIFLFFFFPSPPANPLLSREPTERERGVGGGGGGGLRNLGTQS